MTWNRLSVLAVIPARGGSKGIPNKNLRRVGGRSLIEHAARTAAALKWIDHSVLSTDDEKIAEEGRSCGLDVPFMRPAELAGDLASAVEAWRHAWLASEEHYGCRFDISVLLQPTTPLRRAEDVERTVRQMVEGGHRAAAAVSRVPGHYIPEKIVKLDEQGCLSLYREPGDTLTSRQAFPTYYSRNGVCYSATRDAVVNDRDPVRSDCIGVVIEEPVANIDEPLELEWAEFLAQRMGES
ncbi:MAG: acylneuraminate cytidylyltransferase family protein [Deltaproteobacteria bacterium]|jgi:CMP-N-acetylneuraminic acid synthetase|nr:acylneuraminate cytidylyltransferase family protein [Deltaproteobacteria bacterium]MBW2541087.1 acylneuraminate cytidylyltransferase family protein [Deltaproteobacteria bacterium]